MGSAMMLLLLAASAASLGFASASEQILPHGGEAEVKSSGKCPDKWVDASFVDMGCLFFNTTAGMTWDQASSTCQMGSNSALLEITSDLQMTFIQRELTVIEEFEGRHFQWWTAGTDVGINGQWIWIASLTAVEDFLWYGRFPSSHDDYNCMSLFWSHEFLGVNNPCDKTFYPICQLK